MCGCFSLPFLNLCVVFIKRGVITINITRKVIKGSSGIKRKILSDWNAQSLKGESLRATEIFPKGNISITMKHCNQMK